MWFERHLLRRGGCGGHVGRRLSDVEKNVLKTEIILLMGVSLRLGGTKYEREMFGRGPQNEWRCHGAT
jgi:hypothetical protein